MRSDSLHKMINAVNKSNNSRQRKRGSNYDKYCAPSTRNHDHFRHLGRSLKSIKHGFKFNLATNNTHDAFVSRRCTYLSLQ